MIAGLIALARLVVGIGLLFAVIGGFLLWRLWRALDDTDPKGMR